MQGIVAVAAINAILRVQSAQLGIEGIVVGRTGDIVPAFGQLIGFAGLFGIIARIFIRVEVGGHLFARGHGGNGQPFGLSGQVVVFKRADPGLLEAFGDLGGGPVRTAFIACTVIHGIELSGLGLKVGAGVKAVGRVNAFGGSVLDVVIPGADPGLIKGSKHGCLVPVRTPFEFGVIELRSLGRQVFGHVETGIGADVFGVSAGKKVLVRGHRTERGGHISGSPVTLAIIFDGIELGSLVAQIGFFIKPDRCSHVLSSGG